MTTETSTATDDPLGLLQQRDPALASALAAGDFALRPLDAARHIYGLRTKAAVVDTAKIDTTRLTVPGTITTQDEDRSRDVVRTEGMDLTHHQANPVVLFEHGFGNIGARPIARAEDPSGAYTVERHKNHLRSVSHFSAKSLESMQIFELYAEGLLRGLSVGIIPHQVEYRRESTKADPHGQPPGLLITSCELFEYSFCAVPDNRYALADKVLGKGLLCGRPIVSGILTSLTPYLPERSAQVVGGFEAPPVAETPEIPPMATDTEVTPTPTPTPAPAAAATTPPPAEPTPAPRPAPAATVTAPIPAPLPALYRKSADGNSYIPFEGDGGFDNGTATLPSKPVGAVVSEGIYDRLADLGEFLLDASAKQENERLAIILDEVAEAADTHATNVQEFHSSEYPEQPPLARPADLEGAEWQDGPPEERDTRKRHLTAGIAKLASRLQALRKQRQERPVHTPLTRSAALACTKAAGLLAEVGSSSGTSPLPESLKAAAQHHARTLKDLAAIAGGETEDAELKAAQVEITRLREIVKTVLGQHEQIAKAFRRAQRGR